MFHIPYMRYIWQTISLVNWDIKLMHIGGHFSFANRVILSVLCFKPLHNTRHYK